MLPMNHGLNAYTQPTKTEQTNIGELPILENEEIVLHAEFAELFNKIMIEIFNDVHMGLLR